MGEVGALGNEMLEHAETLRVLWPLAYELAVEWGDEGLARRLDASGQAVIDAGSQYVPAFNEPGRDTTELRTTAWVASATAEEQMGQLVTLGLERAQAAESRVDAAVDSARQRAGWALLGGALVVAAFTLVLRRRLIHDHRIHQDERLVREAEAERNEFEMKLRAGLDMASTEADAHATVARSLSIVAPDLRSELMLADSSRTHFELVAENPVDGCDGCDVRSPNDCPAVRQGHALTFDSSGDLDACPHLAGRSQGTVGALCIPMSIGSQTAGVLHVVHAEDSPVPEAAVALYETVTRVSSDRLGMMRAMARSEAQAATDPLTGLLNRRSLDDRAQQLVVHGTPFTAAFGDLDHFKSLNDVHGHDTGDRALRLFSRILTLETRPQDVVARYGGEEFLILLPGCDADAALVVLDRVRQRLGQQIPSANLPHFTVSFGICEWDGETDLRTVVARADQALLRAKAAGRDRDVVADPERDHDGGPARLDVPDVGEVGPADAA